MFTVPTIFLYGVSKYSYTAKYPCSESTKYPFGSKDGH